VRVRELAERLGLTFEGEGEREVRGVAPIETATHSDLSFVGGAKLFDSANRSAAGCLIVPHEFQNTDRRTLLRAESPRASFAAAVAILVPAPRPVPGVHSSAYVHPGAHVDPNTEVGPHVNVGSGAHIGPGCRIGAGSSIGEQVEIGSDCTVHANVTIYPGVRVGRRAILHSGCVLGADGFGFALANGRYEKFPQIGEVVLEDDVEIGANSCVDRAALGVTLIGEGTKLDNMVHIGHNCRIGRHVVIAAQTGLSGGVVVEDHAVIGGQVGIGDKAKIESRAVLGSGCGILTSKIVRAGQVVWGTPARPLKEYLQQLANLGRIASLRAEVAGLKKRLAAVEERR
jgi:UDP-3-O-[3-hydroxymyristoyl] glucosamine N-acyltransferase